jgi:tripartite ATP-independent transporter DctP family solute receptor
MKNLLRLSVLALLVPLMSCGGGSKKADSSTQSSSVKAVELSIAHIGAIESPSNMAVEHFVELVKERSNGSLIITNFPASQLGGDRDIMEGIIGGSIDMGVPAAGMAALFLPEYYIFDTPYMFVSQEHLNKVVNGELGKQIADKFLEKNKVRVLAQNWERGVRQSIFTKKVQRFEDFAGVKIRLPEIDSYLKGFELLKTRPTIVSFPETYSALQQGVVEGMECPLDWIYDNKFYEICKNLVITNHVFSIMTLLINDAKFQQLTADQQIIITNAAGEAGVFQNNLIRQKEGEYLKNMEAAGVNVSRPDLTPFINAVQPCCRIMIPYGAVECLIRLVPINKEIKRRVWYEISDGRPFKNNRMDRWVFYNGYDEPSGPADRHALCI